jgi:LacI family transcriptional regulator
VSNTTMQVVALKAGVSKSTVSQVLNGRAKELNISDATILRVQQVAEQIGYVPNSVARNLRAQRTGQIGVLVTTLEDVDQSMQLAFDGAWLLGMSMAAQELEFSSALLFEEKHKTDLTRYYDGRIEGLLLRCDPRLRHPLLNQLSPKRLPTVAVWTQDAPTGMGYADVDHAGGAKLAVQHLLELGHRKIAFLDADLDENNSHFKLRFEGYCEALHQAGIQIQANWHVRNVKQILELVNRDHAVTAVFAANDLRGVEVVRELNRAGVQVPEEVSVIGFDNLIGSVFMDVELTTVHHPIREMAREAVKNLAQLIKGLPYWQCRSVVPTQLVVRKTTAVVQGNL